VEEEDNYGNKTHRHIGKTIRKNKKQIKKQKKKERTTTIKWRNKK